ncbi:hypothetical protein LTR16_002724, partial [Cryomyces antarcticus]
IMSKGYLTAAGSILTIEARHSSHLRAALAKLPFPQRFDAPLSPDEVFTLASAFVVGYLASNPPLPLKPFPTLALATAEPGRSGAATRSRSRPGSCWRPKTRVRILYAAFVSVTGPVFTTLTPRRRRAELEGARAAGHQWPELRRAGPCLRGAHGTDVQTPRAFWGWGL